MAKLILSRLLQIPLILGLIFCITFVLVWTIPGNPLLSPDGKKPSKQIQAALAKQYGLDGQHSDIMLKYAKDVLLHGDFGPSLQYKDQRVSQIIQTSLPISASLGIVAMVFALHLGLLVGIIGAIKPNSWLDLGSLSIALLGISLPTFVTGSILMIVFGSILHWFPIAGWESPGHYVLPAIALGIAPAAYIARLIRLGLADICKSDFIRTARAKGVSPLKILLDHSLKIAFLPVLSFLGPALAAVMTGSFVIEKVFAIPGIGQHFVNAVLNRDRFLILGLVLVYSAMLIGFNLIIDLAYTAFDPRIKLEEE